MSEEEIMDLLSSHGIVKQSPEDAETEEATEAWSDDHGGEL